MIEYLNKELKTFARRNGLQLTIKDNDVTDCIYKFSDPITNRSLSFAVDFTKISDKRSANKQKAEICNIIDRTMFQYRRTCPFKPEDYSESEASAKEIIDSIGLPALLEGTAEECNELAQACLKMARKLRRENPTPATMTDLTGNLKEEVADVKVCLTVLDDTVLYASCDVCDIYSTKMDRWLNRIRKAKNEKQNNTKN